MRASIRRSINNSYEAVAEDGRNYTLKIKGKLLKTEKWEYNPIAVGDVVDFIPHSENEGLIMKRCERKSQFTRFLNKVSLNQTVVANMDQAVIITSVRTPAFHPRFIDRAISALKGAKVIIAVNKADLGISDEERKELDVYKTLGYDVVTVSAKDGNVSELLPLLHGKISVFVGQSGVGKSSLVNLITGAEQRIGEVSTKYNRGKHTTNHAIWIDKDDMGIIDTPGIREILPPFEDLRELRDSFVELRDTGCRYSDCLHDGESGCTVPSLIKKGEIDEGRYEGYLSLLYDLKAVEERIIRNRW